MHGLRQSENWVWVSIESYVGVKIKIWVLYFSIYPVWKHLGFRFGLRRAQRPGLSQTEIGKTAPLTGRQIQKKSQNYLNDLGGRAPARPALQGKLSQWITSPNLCKRPNPYLFRNILYPTSDSKMFRILDLGAVTFLQVFLNRDQRFVISKDPRLWSACWFHSGLKKLLIFRSVQGGSGQALILLSF